MGDGIVRLQEERVNDEVKLVRRYKLTGKVGSRQSAVALSLHDIS